MNRLWTSVECIQDIMKKLGAVCLISMALITCIDIAGRFFDHPVFGSEEIVAILAAITIALSLPYAQKKKAHIGVEIVMRLFSQKTQSVIQLCTNILAFGLFIVVTWRMTVYAHTIQKSGQVSMNLEFPEYYVIYLLSFCFFIFTCFLLKDIIMFFKKGETNK